MNRLRLKYFIIGSAVGSLITVLIYSIIDNSIITHGIAILVTIVGTIIVTALTPIIDLVKEKFSEPDQQSQVNCFHLKITREPSILVIDARLPATDSNLKSVTKLDPNGPSSIDIKTSSD